MFFRGYATAFAVPGQNRLTECITALDATLKRTGIQSLVVVGCTTSVCVESTIRGA